MKTELIIDSMLWFSWWNFILIHGMCSQFINIIISRNSRILKVPEMFMRWIFILWRHLKRSKKWICIDFYRQIFKLIRKLPAFDYTCNLKYVNIILSYPYLLYINFQPFILAYKQTYSLILTQSKQIKITDLKNFTEIHH